MRRKRVGRAWLREGEKLFFCLIPNAPLSQTVECGDGSSPMNEVGRLDQGNVGVDAHRTRYPAVDPGPRKQTPQGLHISCSCKKGMIGC